MRPPPAIADQYIERILESVSRVAISAVDVKHSQGGSESRVGFHYFYRMASSDRPWTVRVVLFESLLRGSYQPYLAPLK